MNENTGTPAATPAPKNQRSTIIIGLLLVIILIQGVKWYLDSQEIKEKDEKIETTEQELASTKQRMIEIKNELEQKIAEVKKLGGDVTDLQTAKAEIETELKRTTRANGKVVKDLKDKVEGYELLLKNKDEEIEKLKNVNKELLTENKTLKTEKNQLGDSLNQLSQTKEELATKVAIASQLKVENIKIVAVNERGKERDSPFKNKQLNKLKVDFNIAENNVAPIEGKKILIRIIDENGQVIFDVTRGSGTFMFEGKEEFYTAAQEILFDNTKQKLTFFYEKGSEYASGTYTLEVYTDDYKMGSGQFGVK
jgi:hypothetical protein